MTAVQSTYERLRKAAETPGAIAENELLLAQKQLESARAVTQSRREAPAAAESMFRAQEDLEGYLHIRAPFGGIITERFVHPNALRPWFGFTSSGAWRKVARLRLVILVPEENVGTIVRGHQVAFHVHSSPGRSFHERRFVVRSFGGRAEWVDVVKGISEGGSVEIRGNLRAGDRVVARATDEIREGTTLQWTMRRVMFPSASGYSDG